VFVRVCVCEKERETCILSERVKVTKSVGNWNK